MAIVLPGKFIYLATPYTRDAEIANALKTIKGAFPAYDKFEKVGHDATLDEVKTVCGEQLTGTEVIFTSVRNPYDILAQWFIDNQHHFQMRRAKEILGHKPNFREFLDIWFEMDEHPQFGCRPYMIKGRIFYQAAKCKQIVRYENLQAGLDAVLRRIPGVPSSVPVAAEIPDRDRDHWSLYYDDPTYAYVNEHFQQEFVQFGYPFVWSNNPLV